MATRQQNEEAYDNGRATRSSNESIESCPFGDAELCLKHWWLAGHHDKDMENT